MKKNLSNLFDEFIYECEFVRKARPETLRGYRQAFSTFNKLQPDISIDLLTSIVVIRFFKILEERKRIVGKGIIKSGIKRSTAATYWSKLNSFFSWLAMKGYVVKNPFDELKYPSPTYENRKFLKREEIEKILTAIFIKSKNSLLLKRDLVLFYILLYCGLRKEELLMLQIRDIDFSSKILTVRAETSKSNRTRYIPLHSQLIKHLKEYLNERKKYTTPYLFVSSNRDARLSYAGLKHIVNKLANASDVKFHLHQFRHTFAINFLKQNNNIAKLKQLLGHTNLNATLIYLRCLPTNEMRGDIENMSIDALI